MENDPPHKLIFTMPWSWLCVCDTKLMSFEIVVFFAFFFLKYLCKDVSEKFHIRYQMLSVHFAKRHFAFETKYNPYLFHGFKNFKGSLLWESSKGVRNLACDFYFWQWLLK